MLLLYKLNSLLLNQNFLISNPIFPKDQNILLASAPIMQSNFEFILIESDFNLLVLQFDHDSYPNLIIGVVIRFLNFSQLLVF